MGLPVAKYTSGDEKDSCSRDTQGQRSRSITWAIPLRSRPYPLRFSEREMFAEHALRIRPSPPDAIPASQRHFGEMVFSPIGRSTSADDRMSEAPLPIVDPYNYFMASDFSSHDVDGARSEVRLVDSEPLRRQPGDRSEGQPEPTTVSRTIERVEAARGSSDLLSLYRRLVRLYLHRVATDCSYLTFRIPAHRIEWSSSLQRDLSLNERSLANLREIEEQDLTRARIICLRNNAEASMRRLSMGYRRLVRIPRPALDLVHLLGRDDFRVERLEWKNCLERHCGMPFVELLAESNLLELS
ncbi:hypothetical protein BJ878DRAFT_542341 [Calycina marina]|uniref:Uncharacterized protein n=1 Tax=Calycina marina TaxID=1763456 RepID=A0A9P7Z2Y7_9HELO|nr:hypothetical protein BJ878DRAFT_542341 [Calycina marina]